MVRTKIIATLGPASSDSTILRKMMLAGLDVVRLNFSHGSLNECSRRIALTRELNKRYRRHIKILGDLEGYRIRIGRIENPLEIKKGQILWLTQEDVSANRETVSFDYAGNLRDIKSGQYIYIDDGNIALEVSGHNASALKTRVVVGGILKGHKGVNIPQGKLKFSGLTAKDRQDIKFVIKNRLDYIAQSFVRDKYDILKVRGLLKNSLPDCRIIAKIENREALKNIDEIIGVCDGIMIARGDLGVSVPIYEVPIIQKWIIKKCKAAKKFVITATQMLESMTENLRPTRAEVSDIANAIIDGSDFLMLSAETAVGKYPQEAVSMMNKIIKFTEQSLS